MPEQLTLDLSLNANMTFDNFVPGANAALVATLSQSGFHHSAEQFIYYWGERGSGRSHLLNACCHHVTSEGGKVFYLPGREAHTWPTTVCDSLEQMDLLVIDDCESFAGDKIWEEALFHLYNRSLASGTHWLIAANGPPKQLGIALPDLESRLAASVVYALAVLTDDEKIKALQLHANARGFDLSAELGQYLLNNLPRELSQLFATLDILDKASLQEKRRLTIPFAKQVLNL